MKENERISRWNLRAELKRKAAKFTNDFYGYLSHIIGGGPACIMGFENTGTPYSSQVYQLFEDKNPNITHTEISVNNGKIKGFRKDCVQNRKIIVITENPLDRGAVYAADIARKYASLEGKYNMRGLLFITVSPFEIYAAENLIKKRIIT